VQIWAFVSQKGGSGKTTLATHLAVHAEEQGETVALIDLDPQASAVAWHRVRGSDVPTVAAVSPEDLAGRIEAVEAAGVTLAIIDTAPHTDQGALAAIRVADQIVMPVRPSFLDVAALRDTVRLLEMAEKVDAAIAVINAVPARGGLADEAEEALRSFKVKVAPERIGQRNPLANAIPQGKGVTEFAPKDAAAAEIKALWKRLRGAPKPKSTSKTMSKRK
jgi:chromosome partitioning protein